MLKKSWEQFHADAVTLADIVRTFEPDIIVPCMIGGLFPGAIIAKELGINDVRPIDIERRGEERRLAYDVQGDIAGKRVLLVEDDLPTGKGPAMVKRMYEERGAKVRIASVYVSEQGRHNVDYFIEIYEGEIEYPWKKWHWGDRVREP